MNRAKIASAAEGAGIDPDYVRLALPKRQLPDSDSIDRNLWSALRLRTLLRSPDVLQAQRTMAAPAARVLQAVRINLAITGGFAGPGRPGRVPRLVSTDVLPQWRAALKRLLQAIAAEAEAVS